MKRAIGFLVFIILTKVSFGQTQSIAGAWFWSDSTKQVSMFFKEDGSMQMHSGPKGGVILPENLRSGTYVLTSNLLTIKWVDNAIERDKIKFIDKNSFVLTVAVKNKKNAMTFIRVVDEEVIEQQ